MWRRVHFSDRQNHSLLGASPAGTHVKVQRSAHPEGTERNLSPRTHSLSTLSKAYAIHCNKARGGLLLASTVLVQVVPVMTKVGHAFGE
jgi:hypothetical protein